MGQNFPAENVQCVVNRFCRMWWSIIMNENDFVLPLLIFWTIGSQDLYSFQDILSYEFWIFLDYPENPFPFHNASLMIFFFRSCTLSHFISMMWPGQPILLLYLTSIDITPVYCKWIIYLKLACLIEHCLWRLQWLVVRVYCKSFTHITWGDTI